MNIFKDDLLKNKYFLIIVGCIIVIGFFLYLKQQSSIENKCKRRYQESASFFSGGSKLQQKALESATDQLIKECIREGNK